VPFEQGACLGMPGLTAHRALFADGPVLGATVLITGAAGAVGSAAVQLARWGAATVLATVRRDDDAPHVDAEHVFVQDAALARRVLDVAPGALSQSPEPAGCLGCHGHGCKRARALPRAAAVTISSDRRNVYAAGKQSGARPNVVWSLCQSKMSIHSITRAVSAR
jgi:NAD(P)-dependent dehydrogenase (short-subunit alcohol dehydrogenase family)